MTPGACPSCGYEQWIGGRQHVCRPRRTDSGIAVGDTVAAGSEQKQGAVVALQRGLTGGWLVLVRPTGVVMAQWWPESQVQVVRDDVA